MIKIIFKIFLLLLIIAIIATGIFLYKKQRQAEAKIMGMTPANVSEKVIYLLPQQGNPKRKLRLEIPKILEASFLDKNSQCIVISQVNFSTIDAILKNNWSRVIQLKKDLFYGSGKDPKFSIENTANLYINIFSLEKYLELKERRVRKVTNKLFTEKGTFVNNDVSILGGELFLKEGVILEVAKNSISSKEKIAAIESLYYSFNPIIVEGE